MANFNYYLNRQGPRGRQGEKGEQGFSPIISVLSDTLSEYKLRIQNETGYIETPNLKANPVTISGTGKYVLYDAESNLLYNSLKPSELVDTTMFATTTNAGIIAIADETDLTQDATDVAVTPKQLNDAIDAVEAEIPSAPNNGILTIQQNGVNVATFSADSATNVTANIQTPTNVVTTDTNQSITGNKSFEGTLLYGSYEVATLNDIPSIPTNYVTTDTNQTITGDKDFTGSLTIDGDAVATTNDIPSLTNYVQKTDYATTSAAGVVKVDGTSITIADGVISANYSAPSNMVTTDTSQTISGSKTFTGFFNKFTRGFTIEEASNITFQQGVGGQSTALSIRHGLNDAGLMVTEPNGSTYYKVINSNDFDGTTIIYNSTTNKISAVAQTPTIIDGGEETVSNS